jgi:hypothetical protein
MSPVAQRKRVDGFLGGKRHHQAFGPAGDGACEMGMGVRVWFSRVRVGLSSDVTLLFSRTLARAVCPQR